MQETRKKENKGGWIMVGVSIWLMIKIKSLSSFASTSQKVSTMFEEIYKSDKFDTIQFFSE